MKRIMIAAAAAALVFVANAVEWRGIGEDDHIAGVKISSAEKLKGRVVLVDVWGVNCPPCRALLPQLQEMWMNFGLPANKPFIVLGSHRQERSDTRIKALVEKAGVTYPVYQGAGIVENEPSGGGTLPFMYVLDHRGKVVYKGRDIRAAQEVAITAIGNVGRLPSLTEGVYFVWYKNLESQLVLGKPIGNIVKQLEREANSVGDKPDEARKILAAIKRGLANTKAEIDFQKDYNPREAVRLIKLMKVTWPEEAAAAYKAELPSIIAAAKKQKQKKNGE